MSTAGWEEVLSRFELELDRQEAMADPWHPPAEPLPADLADRARALLRRQQERVAAIREQQDAIAHQLIALRRVPDAASDAPAFLDVAG